MSATKYIILIYSPDLSLVFISDPIDTHDRRLNYGEIKVETLLYSAKELVGDGCHQGKAKRKNMDSCTHT